MAYLFYDVVALLKKIAKTGKWLGWGTVTIGVLADVRDVAITYKEGGDWEKEAFKDTLALMSSYGLSRLGVKIVLSFVPEVGWVIFAITVLASFTGDYLGEKGVNYVFKASSFKS